MITRKPALFVSTLLALLVVPLLTRSAFAQQQQPADTAAIMQAFEQRLAKLESKVDSLQQENQQLRIQVAVANARAGTGALADSSAAPSAAADLKADEAEAAARKAAASASVADASKSTTAPAQSGQKAEASTSLAADSAPATVPSIIKPGGSEQWISVGGFLMVQSEAGDAIDSRFTGLSENDSFYLRRARIVLGGHFAENFDFKIAAEMSGALIGASGMRGQLADGYISWTKYSALNVTAGQFKTSYGHEFLSNDLTVYTIEHAFVTDVLTLGRQIGAQASGTFLKTRLNYSLGIFNGNGVNTNVNDNDQFLYAGRITFMPVKTKIESLGWNATWNIGVNGYRSKDSGITLPDGLSSAAFPGHRTGWGADTQLTVGPLAIWFEYLNTDFDPALASLKKVTADGWFLQGAWNIVPKKWQTVVRYETFDPNTDISGSRTNEWTFGVNYLIKGDDLKLMLDYITSDPRFRSNNYQHEERADRVFLRLQAVF